MNYELHPLCTLFPRMSGAEFDALRDDIAVINGVGKDGLALIRIERSATPKHWLFSHCDVATGQQSSLKRPIHESALASLVGLVDDASSYEFSASTETSKLLPQQISSVYFIQGVDGGLVKIGWSSNPVARLSEFQCGSPVLLRIVRLIQTEDRSLEYRLHRDFAAYRAHGEWFDPAVLSLEAPL